MRLPWEPRLAEEKKKHDEDYPHRDVTFHNWPLKDGGIKQIISTRV